MTERRVVVTGIGTINPLGNNIEEYFSNLEKGVSGAAPITHFDAEKFKTKFACEVKNYDPTQYFDRKEVRKYDLFTQYALIAATQAVEDSALDLEKVDKEQVGEMCARIRRIRKPEPYKGKGIKYETEIIRRKAGKSGAKGK